MTDYRKMKLDTQNLHFYSMEALLITVNSNNWACKLTTRELNFTIVGHPLDSITCGDTNGFVFGITIRKILDTSLSIHIQSREEISQDILVKLSTTTTPIKVFGSRDHKTRTRLLSQSYSEGKSKKFKESLWLLSIGTLCQMIGNSKPPLTWIVGSQLSTINRKALNMRETTITSASWNLCG